jgi:cytochrome P450
MTGADMNRDITKGAPSPPADKMAPAHVPPSLVYDIGRYFEPTTDPDPFHASAHIHEELPPVFYSNSRGKAQGSDGWFVTRYEDVREIYQNDRLYSTWKQVNFQELVGETFLMLPLSIDPPEHGKYRVLLNPWFSPKAVRELEAKITATVNGLIDGFVDKGECDAAYDFGRIYPVRVFMDLMGFPREMMEEFLRWEYAILHSFNDPQRVAWGIGSAIAYLRGFIEETKKKPADNLTSHIVHGQVYGRPLTDDEMIGIVAFLWIGGLDTVAATTALMFRKLAFDGALQAMLRERPEAHAEAVEEFLRMHPTVNVVRTVKQDHEIRGVKIKAGEKVSGLNIAGNYDSEEFEDPRTFRIDRPSNRHFTLAGGSHRCLGAHLARRELRVALTEFLRRVPQFEIKPGADVTVHPGLMATAHLPVVWKT